METPLKDEENEDTQEGLGPLKRRGQDPTGPRQDPDGSHRTPDPDSPPLRTHAQPRPAPRGTTPSGGRGPEGGGGLWAAAVGEATPPWNVPRV